MRLTMLKQRLITSAWSIALVVLAIWFSKPDYNFPGFTILAVAAAIPAAIEFYRLTGVAKALPLFIAGLAFILVFIICPHFTFSLKLPFLSILLTAVVAVTLIILLFLRVKEGAFQQWAWTLGGILYIGWLINLFVSLGLDAGRDWLFLVLLTTFGTDTSAYFIGKSFGKHKMAPRISPKKTWEGAAAGLAGAILVSLFFLLKTPVELHIGWPHAVTLGLLIGVFSQLGDLAESLLKRNFGVKDSGNLMPGHGGMLDRLDSILFSSAVVYLYFFLVII